MPKWNGNAFLSINISPEIVRCKSMEFWRGVRRVGFGTKRLAGAGGGAERRAQAAGLIRRAVELGVNHLDTASFYPSLARAGSLNSFQSLGWANEAIREAAVDREVLIATKVGPQTTGLARPDELQELVERDLRALGRDVLDVVYLRQTGLESVSEHFGVLAQLREKIGRAS